MGLLNNLKYGKKNINQIMKGNKELKEPSEDQLFQLKRKLLYAYKDIMRVCDKYKINHYLIYGSALGAVRHRGFIPWDDDLDICMKRCDYNKFKKIFRKELSNKYILNAPNYSTISRCRFPCVMIKNTIAKEIFDCDDKGMQCIKIDIFLLDKVPKSKIKQFIKGNFCNVLEFIQGQVAMWENVPQSFKRLMYENDKTEYAVRSFVGRLFSFYSASRWNDLIDKAVQYNGNNPLCYGLLTGRKHYFGEWFGTDEITPAKFMVFEDTSAPLFHDPDRMLKKLYGDYMKIPDVEDRERHFFLELYP